MELHCCTYHNDRSSKGDRKMDYYETVMTHYLRSDRALFLNTECCIQLNEGNPDSSGLHWYCDAVAVDFRSHTVFLCEISYSKGLSSLTKRLKGWHDEWERVCLALARDSFLDNSWSFRPWLFVPEHLVSLLLRRLDEIRDGQRPKFSPRVTSLEMIQPWKYQSWNRIGEMTKPDVIPKEMRE
jgi:hypothetical protein